MGSDSLQHKYLESRDSDKKLSSLIASNELKRYITSVILRTLSKYSSRPVDQEDIENIYGQVIFKLTHALLYIKKVVVNFTSYVSRCTSNQTIDYLRSKKLAFIDTGVNPGQVAPPTGKWLVKEAISRIRNQLGDITAQIAYLKIVEELSFREIAELMEMKKSTVADQFKKARKILLRLMEFY